MDELDLFEKMSTIGDPLPINEGAIESSERHQLIVEHKAWLNSIRHEKPSTTKHLRVAVYIRYFNQTKYENYLDFHKAQFVDTLSLCPNWEFVGFYIDEGQSPPNMETAPEWRRLLGDCSDGKVDLIITQKISNVSKKVYEVCICARLLAQQKPPVGIYFISEDMFTLASYYQEDMRDTFFLPSPDWQLLPDEPEERWLLSD